MDKPKTLFRIAIVFAIAVSGAGAAYSQESSDTGEEALPGTETTGAAEESTTEDSENEREPAVDTRKMTLLYGIDTEVLGVLSDLRQESMGTYNEILLEVLADSRNDQIAQAIYGLWSDTSWDGGLESATGELVRVIEDEDYDLEVVQAAIAYLADREYKEALDELQEISGSRETRLAASAVRAVGKIGSPGDEGIESLGAALLERLQDEDPLAEDDLVASLIVTLGELEITEAATELVAIAEDVGAPEGHRRLACISIGKIGREIDFVVIESLFYDSTDATLRAYALAGLAEFEDQDTRAILIQALKRDSFWRIRQTAANELGDKSVTEAAELLRYKAEHDPVNQVKIASIKALGKIGDNDSRKFLIDYYTDTRKGTDVRLAALNVLVENQLRGTNDAIMEVMDELWEKDQGRFLEYTCRELSRAEWDSLAPVYERMLDHSNWLMQVYGIRGIRRNAISSLNSRVEALDADGVDGRTRREVTSGG